MTAERKGDGDIAEGAIDDRVLAGWHTPLPEHLPRPTAAPAAVAFGATFLAWGVVTSWVISGVGLIVFAGGIAVWIKEMRLEQRGSEQQNN